MTTLLHISDTHIMPPGTLLAGRLDTAAALSALVARINTLLPQIDPVDGLLVTGDISGDGTPESYAAFKTLMAPLDLPLYLLPGNHDLRAPMRDAFAEHDYLPKTGKLNWHRRVGDLDIIALDTLIEHQGGGELDKATLAFLTDALQRAQDRPVLLALHHPPFSSGIAFMDDIGLAGIPALTDILHGRSAEIRIVCGHIHSTMIATVGGKVALSCPSPCSSFAYTTLPDAPVGFMTQPDGFMLHHWQGGFRSVRIPVDPGQGPNPF